MDWNDVGKFVKPLSWPEVFEIWQANEEKGHWEEVWKAKGFSSWAEWRHKTHDGLMGDKLSWGLHEVTEPSATIPLLHGGLFHAWSTWFYGPFNKQTPTFDELVRHPGVANHHLILKLLEAFPTQTTMTAVHHFDGRIMIVEGMHRACAIALAAKQGRPVTTRLLLACADLGRTEVPKLGIGWEK